jgi:hypothetical protein
MPSLNAIDTDIDVSSGLQAFIAERFSRGKPLKPALRVKL